jgi:hypothetical protein
MKMKEIAMNKRKMIDGFTPSPVWVMLLVTLIASAALAQDELTWSTIDDGGKGCLL